MTGEDGKAAASHHGNGLPRPRESLATWVATAVGLALLFIGLFYLPFVLYGGICPLLFFGSLAVLGFMVVAFEILHRKSDA